MTVMTVLQTAAVTTVAASQMAAAAEVCSTAKLRRAVQPLQHHWMMQVSDCSTALPALCCAAWLSTYCVMQRSYMAAAHGDLHRGICLLGLRAAALFFGQAVR
jgi:hypothetical protein